MDEGAHDQAHELPDLGFGPVVGSLRGQRLVNRDGTFTVHRRGLGLRATLSLYYRLLTIPWPSFLGLVVLAYLATNMLFACVYFACGPGALGGTGEHGFRRSFFFSVQSLSTIGYGHVYPASLAAELTMTAEALTGVIGFAFAAGLVFARFSRPQADFVFSRNALIAAYRGGHGLVLRVANQRRNQIIELQAKIYLSLIQHRDGRPKRRFEELALERERVPFFPLSWTIVHPIDEHSPLRDLDEDDLVQGDVEILVLLTGIDETFFETVHARTSYKADEIVWRARFKDIYERTGTGVPVAIDVARIHDFEYEEGEVEMGTWA